jgi:hypothetical protein
MRIFANNKVVAKIDPVRPALAPLNTVVGPSTAPYRKPANLTRKASRNAIGVCLVTPDCSLTEQEVRDRANNAAAFAKDQGRNRIATYAGPNLEPGQLKIVAGG